MSHNKILLVDDDDDDQFIFKEALHETIASVECITANNGLEALEKLRLMKELPSLFFVDLNMPFMNGFQLLEEIKKQKHLSHIPVIILTTSTSEEDKKRSLLMGANLFLSKTANFKLLKEDISKILQAF